MYSQNIFINQTPLAQKNVIEVSSEINTFTF